MYCSALDLKNHPAKNRRDIFRRACRYAAHWPSYRLCHGSWHPEAETMINLINHDSSLFWFGPLQWVAQSWKIRHLKARWMHFTDIFRVQHFFCFYFGFLYHNILCLVFDTTIHPLFGVLKVQRTATFEKPCCSQGSTQCPVVEILKNMNDNGTKDLAIAAFLPQR